MDGKKVYLPVTTVIPATERLCCGQALILPEENIQRELLCKQCVSQMILYKQKRVLHWQHPFLIYNADHSAVSSSLGR